MDPLHSASGEPCSLGNLDPHHDETQLDPAFVDRLKIAAATAIIKQKPASMSGKDYAKQLADRLRKKEATWKAKAKKLEMELLKTKQELLLARTKTTVPIGLNEQGGAAIQSYSDTSTDEPAFLTPPSSSEEHPHIDHKMVLSRNTNFLHSLSTLCALGRNADLKTLERSSEVIVDSVKTTVDYIIGKSKGKTPSHLLSSRMLQEAADAIVKSLDTKLPPGCRDDVVTLVERLVETVLEEVMGNSKICNTYSQRDSCCILLRLSKSPHLLPIILYAILEKIEKVSTSLRNIRNHGNYLDVQLLENSFFLFSTMEDVLVSVKTSSSLSTTRASAPKSSCNAGQVSSTRETSSQLNRTATSAYLGQTSSQTYDDVDEDDTDNQELRGKAGRGKTSNLRLSLDQGFRTNIQQRLEDSLLHISHVFPLYAQYVWRLTGILELMNENQ